jgi:hypothetical protein
LIRVGGAAGGRGRWGEVRGAGEGGGEGGGGNSRGEGREGGVEQMLFAGCQDRIPQIVDGLGDQNSLSGFLPDFVSFFSIIALIQNTLNHNTL